MNLSKNKFLVSVLILAVTIYLLSAPTAHAEGALATIVTAIIVIAAVAVIAYCQACAPALAPVITGTTTTTLVAAEVLTNVIAYSTINGVISSIAFGAGGATLIVTTTAVITTTFFTTMVLTATGMAIIGSALVGLVACAEGVICPGGQTSGMILTAVSSDMGCTYQIPMTFYNWKKDVKYGYPAFYYTVGSGDNESSESIGNALRYKNSNCTNQVTDPYSGDNRYAMLPLYGGTYCQPIYPSNIFQYLSGYDREGYPDYVGIGFSPHYRDSACADLIPDPSSPDIRYAKVSGVGCVSVAPPYYGITYSYTYPYDQYQQVKIYRFALSTDSDQATLNNWFINTIKANVGNGWENASLGEYYRASVESTPIITASYADLCEGNVCKFTDGTVPENSYVAYVAKVLGNYTFNFSRTIYESGGETSSESYLLTKENKFFNIDNNADYAFFPNTRSGYIGNAIVGPFKTDPCPTCANGATNPPACDTCTAPLVWGGSSCVAPVNAACGSANGASFDTIPTANLCSVGTASAVSGSGPWTWTCAGLYGGAPASCSAGINTYPFSVAISGSGTITSSPADIICDSTCSRAFNYGTTVTLTASASGGSAFIGWSGGCSGTGSCTVVVNGAESVTASFAALPGDFSLSLGGGGGSGAVSCNSVPLSWTASSGATAYRILRGSPRVDISPYQPYPALNYSDTTVNENTSYTYQIEAYSSAGAKRSNSINIATPYCPPTLSFSSSLTSIYQAQSVTLSWSSANTTSCSASGAWSGSKPTNGNQIVVPLPPPSVTYNMTCSGPGGTTSQSVTINVLALILPNWREIIPR